MPLPSTYAAQLSMIGLHLSSMSLRTYVSDILILWGSLPCGLAKRDLHFMDYVVRADAMLSSECRKMFGVGRGVRPLNSKEHERATFRGDLLLKLGDAITGAREHGTSQSAAASSRAVLEPALGPVGRSV